jgi:hypothetical protein
LPAFPTLAQLQSEWLRFLAAYHATPHSTLSQLLGKPTTPLDFYLGFLPPDVRYPQALELSDLFLVEATRRVNADASVRLACLLWEVSTRLPGRRVPCYDSPVQGDRQWGARVDRGWRGDSQAAEWR